MSRDVLQVIQEEISELEGKLQEYQEARSAILRARGVEDPGTIEGQPTSLRLEYVNMLPAVAIERYLEKIGRGATPNDIIRELMRGGAGINKKRGEHNIRIAIENSIHTGRLVFRGAKVNARDLKAVQEAVAKNEGMVEKNPTWKG